VNGLMIGAFARMSRVLRGFGAEGRADGEPFLAAARRAAGFIRERMWNAGTGVLLRRYRDGAAEIDGYAEDYAYLIAGLLELLQAIRRRCGSSGDRVAAKTGRAVLGRDVGRLVQHDRPRSERAAAHEEDYDGAEPTASSVSVLNLLVLSHLVADAQWDERIDRTLRLFGTRLEQMGRGVPMMAAALSTRIAGLQQIVVVEPADDPSNDSLAPKPRAGGAAARSYAVGSVSAVCHPTPRHARDAAALAGSLPFIGAMRPIDGAAARTSAAISPVARR